MLYCVAVCGSVLQCVSVCCRFPVSPRKCAIDRGRMHCWQPRFEICCIVLQHVVACSRLLVCATEGQEMRVTQAVDGSFFPPMGAFKTLVFVLRSYRKLEWAMGQNSWMGKKGWTHTSLVDYFMATRTFQTWFHRCSTVSYCGSFLLRSHLVIRDSDNWQMGSDPHLWDVSEVNRGIIKCFNVNIQTWVIFVRADQVQGVLKSHFQRHGSCLHWLDKGAKISLRKGLWQTGERTKIISHTKFGWANLSKMKEPLSRLQILSPISVGRLIKLTPRHACNDIWTQSQVVSTLGKVIRW